MSKIFGDIRQIAFIVDDIDRAMGLWAETLGVGPFFVKRHIRFSDFVYRGQSGPSPEVSIALANSGYIQVELIQQHDDTPSIYREFIDAGRQGMQHVSSWTTTEEQQKKRTVLLEQGYTLAQECVIASSGVRLLYFDTEQGDGACMFEISDLKEPHHYARVMGIRSAHDAWDGQNPTEDVAQ